MIKSQKTRKFRHFIVCCLAAVSRIKFNITVRFLVMILIDFLLLCIVTIMISKKSISNITRKRTVILNFIRLTAAKQQTIK